MQWSVVILTFDSSQNTPLGWFSWAVVRVCVVCCMFCPLTMQSISMVFFSPSASFLYPSLPPLTERNIFSFIIFFIYCCYYRYTTWDSVFPVWISFIYRVEDRCTEEILLMSLKKRYKLFWRAITNRSFQCEGKTNKNYVCF